jgi:N utilization substance protein B
VRRRSRGREYALQMLYEIEITHKPVADVIADFWEEAEGVGEGPEADEIRSFANLLVKKVVELHDRIDEQIEKSAEHWKISRMALVDRNILRIGAVEILHMDDVPSKVAINESIELAKKFGDAESSKFVNGILDKVAKINKTL